MARPQSFVFVPAKSIDDTHPGRLKQEIAKNFVNYEKLSKSEAACAMAILNPGHGNNTTNAEPIMDSDAGRVFLAKSVWTETISVPAGVTSVAFANAPFFEVPFLYHNGTRWTAFQSPHFSSSSATNKQTCAPYMYNRHIYAYRCVGKSMTIDNTTAPVNKSGACTVGRKTSDVDYTTRTYSAGTVDVIQNQPIMQRLPITSDELSKMNSSTDSWGAELGAYLISKHENYDWVVRDDYTKKAFPTQDAATLVGGFNTVPQVTNMSTGVQSAIVFNYDNSYVPMVGANDNTDVPMACFSGLTSPTLGTTSFTVKCAMVYEFKLKASSDLVQYSVQRPIANAALFDYIRQFECASKGLHPADYNFWDKLWAAFKKIWNGGGATLASRAADSLYPGAGAVARTIGDVVTNL